jgi:hypothetical protein
MSGGGGSEAISWLSSRQGDSNAFVGETIHLLAEGPEGLVLLWFNAGRRDEDGQPDGDA